MEQMEPEVLPPAPVEPKKNNTVLFVVIGVVILCCFCCALLLAAQLILQNSDFSLVNTLNQLG